MGLCFAMILGFSDIYIFWGGGTGHLIKDIDSDSPAAKAGLRDNDILVAVNGEPIEALDHEAVVEKIRQSGENTTLLVVDEETDTMYKMVRYTA